MDFRRTLLTLLKMDQQVMSMSNVFRLITILREIEEGAVYFVLCTLHFVITILITGIV